MSNPQVVVDFVANTAGLSQGMKQATSGSEGLGSKLKSMGRAAVAAAGVAGLAALTATLKIGIDEMEEHAKVSAQTAAVIKSTGGAAGVTAKQVESLAGSLMRKSGVDDETIQSGENLLLTFRNIQNQAGKGNDIFTRATKTMLDMSVALGQDTKSSAIQLGKALNDPIKGITALSRVGVSFTDGQKKQIKAMVESGNVLGAQKVILKELNKEFGGSAAAMGKTLPGQINILKESFKNLAGDLVTLLVPALSAITKFFVQNPGLAKAMVIGVLAIAAAMVVLNAALLVASAITAPYMLLIVGITAGVIALVAAAVLLYKNWDTVTGVLKKGFGVIKNAAADVFGWIKSNWPLLLGILTGPVGVAIALIVTHWDTVKKATTAAFNAVKNTVTSVLNAIKNVISNTVSAMGNIVSSGWNAIKNATANVWNAIKSTVSSVINSVKSLISGLASWIGGAASSAVGNALRKVQDVFRFIHDGASSAVTNVKNAINGLASWIGNVASGAVGSALRKVQDVFRFVRDGANTAVDGVKDAFNGLVKWIEGIAGGVGRAASSVANAIKGPINSVLRDWNSISLHVPSISLPSVKILGHKVGGGSFGGWTIGFPDVPLLAKGAVVDQPTLAMVGEGSGRELVTPEALLRQLLAESQPEIRVYIGDTELRGLVRTEVTGANTSLARSLLAG